MKKTIRVKSHMRTGSKVNAHMRTIEKKKASLGNTKSPINMNTKPPKQEAIAIFYNGGYKIFEFQGHDEFLKLQNKYGRGKIIDGQTVKQFIVYEDREKQEYPRNRSQNINSNKKATFSGNGNEYIGWIFYLSDKNPHYKTFSTIQEAKKYFVKNNYSVDWRGLDKNKITKVKST